MERKWNAYTTSTWINTTLIFIFLQQLKGGGEILRNFWGKLVAAEINIPLESMEKCMGKKQTVWRVYLLLMQRGAEAGVME